MAKGLREIKGRIKAVKGTAQITRAMQLVASSKMKRAQDAALAGREYRRLLADMLDGALTRVGEKFEHPLTVSREIVRKRAIVLVTTDKGLCGGLNTNILRLVSELPKDDCVFVTVGKKGAQYVARTGRTLLADFPVSDKANFAEVRVIGEFLLQKYLEGEVDSVEVVYPQFKNALLQLPVNVKLLPVTDLAARAHELHVKLGNPASGSIVEDDRDMIFEPSVEGVLAELPALYFKEELHQKVLEAKASEHSARMVAMKAATDNAKKIAHALTLEYNKSRQAAITQEILEITAAANA